MSGASTNNNSAVINLFVPLDLPFGFGFAFSLINNLMGGPRCLCGHCGRHHNQAGDGEADAARFADLLAASFFESLRQAAESSDTKKPTAPLIIESFERTVVRDGDAHCGQTCTVCQDVFATGETVCTLPCNRHSFHDGCVRPWLEANNTCPLCRFQFYTTDEQFNRDVVGPAQKKHKADAQAARDRTLSAIRNGETPSEFRDKCIRSAILGHECELRCPSTTVMSENLPAAAEGSTAATARLPSAACAGTAMVRLHCCSHTWHQPCLIEEQQLLRTLHSQQNRSAASTTESDDVSDFFVCPACHKTSDGYIVIPAHSD